MDQVVLQCLCGQSVFIPAQSQSHHTSYKCPGCGRPIAGPTEKPTAYREPSPTPQSKGTRYRSQPRQPAGLSQEAKIKILVAVIAAGVCVCLIGAVGLFFYLGSRESRHAGIDAVGEFQGGDFENFDPNAINIPPMMDARGSLADRGDSVQPTTALPEVMSRSLEAARGQQEKMEQRESEQRAEEAGMRQQAENSVGDSPRPDLIGDFADLIEVVEPSVVRIDVKGAAGGSQGSGFAIDEYGTIVTNYHVIEGATEVSVRNVRGESTLSLGFVSYDDKRDIAIIRVDPDRIDLKPLPLAPQLPRKGEQTASFGSPLGFDFTAAKGVVSSVRDSESLRTSILGRAGEIPGEGLDITWVQTTAAISSGNSGGPLVNFRGELIGMNTWVIRQGQNLNFALAVTEIKNAIQKVSPSSAKVVKAYSSLPAAKRSRSGKLITLSPELKEDSSGHDFVKSTIDGAVRQWQVSSEPISDLGVSENGMHIAIVAGDGSCYVIDGYTGKSKYRLFANDAKVMDVEFNQISQILTYRTTNGLYDGSGLTIRQVSTGEVVNYDGLSDLPGTEVATFSAAPDGSRMFLSWSNGLTSFWKRSLREKRYGIMILIDRRMREGRYVSGSDISGERSEIALGDSSGWLSLVSTLGSRARKLKDIKLFEGAVTSVKYSSDNRKILAAGSDGTVFLVRNLTSRKLRKNFVVREKGVSVVSADYYSLSDRIGLVRSNGSVEIWDVKTLNRVDSFPARSQPGTRACFTSDGKFLMVGFSDGYVAMYPTR